MNSVENLTEQMKKLNTEDQIKIVKQILNHLDYTKANSDELVVKDVEATYNSITKNEMQQDSKTENQKKIGSRKKSAFFYKHELVNDILKLPDEKAKKLYLIFNPIIKGLTKEENKKQNWKDDFRKISIWKNDDFEYIQDGFNKWKIEEFGLIAQ